jgi:hypothetical protein
VGAKSWVLLAVGVVAGVGLTLVSAAVRDAIMDAVDAVADWWWDLVATVRMWLVRLGLLVLAGLAGWAVVALVLPRLAQ